MPRIPRTFLKNQFFHVMTQGINKEAIFFISEDAKFYIRKILQLKDEYKIKVVAYCIMNNHAHMLLNIQDICQLSLFMHKLNTIYAIYYNKKNRRVGYVFRDRYRSEPIQNEQQLFNCIQYIYDNPVKAGICNNPGDYPFSNYEPGKIYSDIKNNGKFTFLDTDEDQLYSSQEVITKFLQIKKKSIEQVKADEYELKCLINEIKGKCGKSLRSIAQILELNREKIRQTYNK